VPYVLKPNTSRPFLHGQIRVNSLGLCDREVPLDKGTHYRIVVLGSSHTQCPPVEATDTPWPAKLERLIRARIASDREIEVLNAGAAAYTIEHNLHRLKDVVLPLKPDMIITYFGYNEFEAFRKEFPLPKIPTRPRPRASILIGKVDQRFHNWLAEQSPDPPPLGDDVLLSPRLAQCRMADAYREYVEIARREGIQLVVCNFNMAVDEQSPQDVIRFYGQAFPNVRYMIEANRLNTAMLKQVIPPETGARLIDVQSDLNGCWDHEYLDLVHLSETGKETLAENVLRGIADLLPRQRSSEPLPPVANRPKDNSRN
jgi:lysophospholipase L1-like esterase